VATKDQVLIPETLLKKRKAQEKSRERNIAELEKRKKVSFHSFSVMWMIAVMIIPNTRLDPRVNVVAFLYHLSGLSDGDEQAFFSTIRHEPCC
jgi:hypothetical protein